jgi:hypothetical protein
LFQFWVLLNLKVISIPVLSLALYRKCYVALTGLGLLLAASYGLRAVGRSTNEVYVSFLRTLADARADPRAHKVRNYLFILMDFFHHLFSGCRGRSRDTILTFLLGPSSSSGTTMKGKDAANFENIKILQCLWNKCLN